MSTTNSVVCEEIFDESSHPSLDEIRDYAKKIGIDPEAEPMLLPLAAEGLMRALPPGWKPVLDEKSKSYYYFNNSTGKTQWEHPLDDIYRNIVKKKRTESQSLSYGEPNEDATYTRDDLPSYEESPVMSKPFEVISLGARKKEIKLSPIVPKVDEITPKLLRQKSEERPISAYVNKKIGLSLSASFDGKPDINTESPKKDFKLSGGGSMFLKSKIKSSEELKTTAEDNEENKVVTNSSTPKGILRERSFVENKSIEEDDKKNVRFNINDNQNQFDMSGASASQNSNENAGALQVKIKPRPQTAVTENGSEKSSKLKIIKPNPTDFVKPKINSSDNEPSNIVSDSEDESIMRSIDTKARLSKKSELNELIEKDEFLIAESIADKFQEDNDAIIKQLKANADRQLEDMKKTIWEEKNSEINKYREDLQDSQKKELGRILSTEKETYEEFIKHELENLRTEMKSRNLGALQDEKKSLDLEVGLAKLELSNKYKLEIDNYDKILNSNFEIQKADLVKIYKLKLEEIEKHLKHDLDKHKDELIVSHNAILDDIKKHHRSILEEIKQDYKAEEKIVRKEHEIQINELKKKVSGSIDNELSLSHSKDTNEDRLYEKVRCEKRLLEDKYRCLKEKYLRLKTDVKLSIEKRNRKREQSTTNTTGSETERSNSNNKERSPSHSPIHPKLSEKPPLQRGDLNSNRQKPDHKPTRTIIIQDLDTSTSEKSCKNDVKLDYDSSEDNVVCAGRSRKKIFSRIKSSSTTRINNNKIKKMQRSCSPVENLRRQLQKLEDLEDQFPQNAQSDTYHLRYPFSDGQKFEGSSELEFFRHRIHLERDSIKRAKESLRTQKCLFQQRQNDHKLKHGSMARHTLQQLCQEEKDLTDMEVSLHRTRSLLGEKVIRLRHLEQSLQRATAVSNEHVKQEETLSDLSSHSASSGISSTEFATAADGAKTILRGEHLQESSEIIQSLENLNSEIREIWEVLNQQQAGNMASVMPLPLVYPDLGWPVLAGTATVPAPPSIPTLADRLHNYRQQVALANAQSTVVTHAANQGATTSLVERTRNLRHWLRQAGVEPGTDNVAPQATL